MNLKKIMVVMITVVVSLWGNDTEACYGRICVQGIEIWTTLDLLRAISIADDDKLRLAHELVNVFLDYYALIRQWSLKLVSRDQAQAEIAHLIILLDYMRDALGDVYVASTNDDLVSINVILGKIEELCCLPS